MTISDISPSDAVFYEEEEKTARSHGHHKKKHVANSEITAALNIARAALSQESSSLMDSLQERSIVPLNTKTYGILAILGLLVGGACAYGRKKPPASAPNAPAPEAAQEVVTPEPARAPTPPPIVVKPLPPAVPMEQPIPTCTHQGQLDDIEFVFRHIANDGPLDLARNASELEIRGKRIAPLNPFVLFITVKPEYIRKVLSFNGWADWMPKPRFIRETLEKMVRDLSALRFHTQDLARKMGKDQRLIQWFVTSPTWKNRERGYAHCEAFLRYLFFGEIPGRK